MKIGVVTLYDEKMKSYGEFTAQNKREYCERHGYIFRCFTEKLDHVRPAQWSKLIAIEQTFVEHPELEWILWSDADALILKPEIQLEQFIDDRYHWICSTDRNGLNTGNFFVRNSDWGRAALKQLWHWEDFRDPWFEQSALLRWIIADSTINPHIKMIGDAINGYPEAPRGFILHCPAIPEEHRRKIIMDALQSLKTPQ